MRRTFLKAMLVVGLAAFAAGASRAEIDTAATGSCEAELDAARQEVQKNKDLVGIWKGHVKTLTKERDAAQKELEAMRAQQPGAAPTASVDAGLVDDLKYQLNALRAENQELISNMNRLQSAPQPMPVQKAPVDDARIAALQQQIDLSRRNQELLTQDKAKLAAEMAELRERLRQAEEQRSNESMDETASSGVDEEELNALREQVTRLRDENTKLSRRAAEAESKRAAMAVAPAPAPIRTDDSARVRDLEMQIERLREQNDRLSRQAMTPSAYSPMSPNPADEDVQKLIRDKNEAERAYAQLESETRNESQKLKTLIFTLQAENKKIDVLRDELRKAQADADSSRQAYADMERNLRAEIDRANSKIAQQKAEIDRLRGYESELQAASEYKQQAEAAYRSLEDSHQGEITRIQARLTSLQADSEQLRVVRGELKRTQEQRAQLEQMVTELRRTQAQLERRIQEQEGQIDMHTREIQQVRASIEGQLEALSQKTLRHS